MRYLVVIVVSAVLMISGCTATAQVSDPRQEPITEAERQAVSQIFDDVAARFPNASSSGDLVAGGPCPFGNQYGELLIERRQVLCIIEDTVTIYTVSPDPIAVSLKEELAPEEFVVTTDAEGKVQWLEADLDDDRFVFVERFVAGFSVVSAQLVRGVADAESIAIELDRELALTATTRVRQLATTDLAAILVSADAAYD